MPKFPFLHRNGNFYVIYIHIVISSVIFDIIIIISKNRFFSTYSDVILYFDCYLQQKQAVPAPKSRANPDLHPFSRIKSNANSYISKKACCACTHESEPSLIYIRSSKSNPMQIPIHQKTLRNQSMHYDYTVLKTNLFQKLFEMLKYNFQPSVWCLTQSQIQRLLCESTLLCG